MITLQVDGIENPKVQSVFFPDLPLHTAAFANDGAQVPMQHDALMLDVSRCCCPLVSFQATYRRCTITCWQDAVQCKPQWLYGAHLLHSMPLPVCSAAQNQREAGVHAQLVHQKFLVCCLEHISPP